MGLRRNVDRRLEKAAARLLIGPIDLKRAFAMNEISFNQEMLTKKTPGLFDVETTLAHFAIVTYYVDPESLRVHIDERFEPDCVETPDGKKALVSVVPFLDRDFRYVRFPWLQWEFGQTNYRAYVTDKETGEHVAWFFGTVLDSIFVNIPRHLWKLPWHRAKIRFDTSYDKEQARYTRYRMSATSDWASAELELEDSGQELKSLDGFLSLESGRVILTHPMIGAFNRRDGRLGSYSIWHDKLELTTGRAVTARFPLLHRLGLVEKGDLSGLHSVLIQPRTEFTIYLPPTPL
ncbi:MAG: hypothetical protein ACI97A_000786 [Planctomycetota bacterium]